MPLPARQLAHRLRRFQDLAFDRTQGRLWPKIENVLPLNHYSPNQPQVVIPLIKNTQQNRLLSRRLGVPASVPQSSRSRPTPAAAQPAPPPKIKSLPPIPVVDWSLPSSKTGPMSAQAYQQKIDELQQQNQELEQAVQAIKKQTIALRQNLQASHQKHQEHASFLQQKRARVKSLQENLTTTRAATEKLKRQLRAKEQELQQIRQKTLSQSAQLELTQSEKKASEAMVKNLKAALANLQKEHGVSPHQIEKLQVKLRQKEEEVRQKDQKLQELTTKLQGELRLKQETQLLHSQIDKLSKSKKGLESALAREQDQLRKIQNRAKKLARHAREQNQTIKAQEQALQKLANEKLKLATFIDELVEKLKSAKNSQKLREIIELELPKGQKALDEASQNQQKPPVKKIKLSRQPSKLPQITDLPNAINGLVKDTQGNLLQGAVVIIKGADDKPLRAVKTNELGQFAVSTPMSNGRYLIEAHQEGLKFDILEVELKGGKLPPIEIIAHD